MSNKLDLQYLKNRALENSLDKQGEEFTSLSSFDKFIKTYRIESGTYKIETFIMYQLYLLSVQKYDINIPLSKIDFFRKLCNNIERVRWGNQRYYLVNRELLNLSDKLEFDMRINEKARKQELL